MYQKLIFQKDGKFSLFNPVKRYFDNVKKEEISIGKIIVFLNNEKNILNRDNITLEMLLGDKYLIKA